MDDSFEPGDVMEHSSEPSQAERGSRTSIFRRSDQDHPDRTPPASETPPRRDASAQAVESIAVTLENEPAADEAPPSLLPKSPTTLAEVGLSKAFLTDLTLKIMHYSGTPSTAQLMRRLGLGQSMVRQILNALQEERLCEVLSQSDLYTGNYRYRLSERGNARVSEALERTRYAGPVPVTAEQYADTVRAFQAQRETPSPMRIKSILDELVLAPAVADAVARALYSGKTTLFHGPSGNGKTHILERYAHSLEGIVPVPYAIYAYGQVIRVFDPSIHEPVAEPGGKEDANVDGRWVLVRRPAVILGSEIGQESLDVAYDPQARFYQAPPHIKAQGGVLVVDDLGRQRFSTRELMTRWLIPVERGWDSLNLVTGEKLTIPFDVQLLFGTNQPMDQLADDALLRRILYKVEIPSPGPDQFAEIMRQLCHHRNVQATEDAIEKVVQRLYGQSSERPRAAYARDLIEVIIEGAAYDGREPVLDEESFEQAFKLFMSQHFPQGERPKAARPETPR